MDHKRVLELIEKAKRPGLLGIVGKSVEVQCRQDLIAYFKLLKRKVLALNLEKLATSVQTRDKEIIKHTVVMRLQNTLRKIRPELLAVMAVNYQSALMKAAKQELVVEADKPQDALPIDVLGSSGQQAADWAATQAAELVKGIDKTTQDTIADVVAEGIEEMKGVGGIAKDLRDILDGMTKFRAEMIASTEMNRAFSAVTMDKIGKLGYTFKRIVLSDDACPICEENADEDPIPVDDTYSSGDDAPPFHPNCRCAIVAARDPDLEDEGD